MGKYYVAGIPFDSENSLKHYGVKGMEWNKHKFGLDADTRYIKWLKDAGMNIGKFANNAAQNVANGITTAANQAGRTIGNAANQATKWAGQQAQNVANGVNNAANTVGSAVNKGANFVTGNQNKQEYQNQSAASRTMRNPQQAQQRATNTYNQQQSKTLPGMAKTAAQNAGKAVSTAYRESGIKGNVDRIGRAANDAITGNVNRATAQSYRNLADFQEDQNAPFHAEAPRYEPEYLRKKAEEYEKRADDALIPKVQRAAENVSNAVSGAANAVGNRASQVARNVGDFVDTNVTGNTAREIAPYTRNPERAQQSADNSMFGRIGNAANAAGDWAKDAAGKVADVALWPATREGVANAAQNVGNTVSGAANKAAEGAKGFLNSAGQWVSGAANNVKNTASKAASDASKGASGFLNSAGQWVSNAAGNVKKAATDAGNAVGQAAQNVGNTVGQAAEQARGGIGGFFDRVGNAVGGAAQNVGNWAGNAAKDVGGAVQNAGNWIGDRAGDVRNAVGGAAQNVGEAVQNAGQTVANIPQNIANWYTGNDVQQEAQRQRELGQLNQQLGNSQINAARDGNWDSDEKQLDMWDEGVRNYLEGGKQLRSADRYMDMYNNAPRQKITSGIENVADAVGQATRNVGGAVSGAANAVSDWVGDRVSDARDAITAPARNAAFNRMRDKNDAAWDEGMEKYRQTADIGYYPVNSNSPASRAIDNNWDQYRKEEAYINQHPLLSAANYAGNQIGDWARTAAGNVGNTVSGAAGNVGNWARDAAGNVGNWAGQAAQNVGNFANREFVQPFADLARAYGLDRMDETSGWYGRATQGPPLVPAAINWVRNNNPFFRHSALSEKPDGVSDAFWEKFTADGGTREEYERDWR